MKHGSQLLTKDLPQAMAGALGHKSGSRARALVLVFVMFRVAVKYELFAMVCVAAKRWLNNEIMKNVMLCCRKSDDLS